MKGLASDPQAGFSILQSLMMIALSFAMAAGYRVITASQERSLKASAMRMDLSEIRTIIQRHVACDRSRLSVCRAGARPYSPPLLTVGRAIDMETVRYATQKDELVTVEGSKSDDNTGYAKPSWVIHTSCGAKGIDVRYARIAGDRFSRDPLSGLPYTWKPLFEEPLCPR